MNYNANGQQGATEQARLDSNGHPDDPTSDDIRQRRDQIIALARQHRACQVAVFGSLVRGEMGADSDIDFLVEFETGYKLRANPRLAASVRPASGRGRSRLFA